MANNEVEIALVRKLKVRMAIGPRQEPQNGAFDERGRHALEWLNIRVNVLEFGQPLAARSGGPSLGRGVQRREVRRHFAFEFARESVAFGFCIACACVDRSKHTLEQASDQREIPTAQSVAPFADP